MLTSLAAFGRILQLLLAIECLFAGGPDKFSFAIDARDERVGKLVSVADLSVLFLESVAALL